MERKVYRSLDKPQSFFGIRGRYTTWMAVALIGLLVVSFLIASFTVSYIGFIVFGCGALVCYLYVISTQDKLSDRAMTRRMNGSRLASCIRRQPGRVADLFEDTGVSRR